MCKSVPEVVPIGVLHPIRVELTKHISESPANRVTIRFACVNVKIRIVHAVIRMVNIDRLRRDVQITEPNSGHVRIESLPKVSARLVKPFHLRYILIHYLALLRELPDYLKLLLVVAYHTGVRKGELFKIGKDQVDLSSHPRYTPE